MRQPKHWASLTDRQRTALYVEQDENEINAVDLGIAKFREKCANTPKSQWSAGRSLVASAVEDVVHGIECARLKLEEGTAMKGASGWCMPFMIMDPGVMALSTLCVMLDGHNTDDRGIPLAKLITRLGDSMEMEFHMQMLRTEAPKLKAVMDRRVRNWNRRSIGRAREQMGELGAAWKLKVKRNTAAKLIAIVLEETDLFNLVMVQQTRRKRVNVVRLSDHTVTALAKTNERLEIGKPVCMPMVVPPNDWGPGQRGGYRILSRYYNAVIRKNYEEEDDEPHSPEVYAALNRLQQTEWKINQVVHDTMTHVWVRGGGWGGIPKADNVEIPKDYPVDGTAAEQKAWRQNAALLHQANARSVGKRMSFLGCLDQANALLGKVFYFPHRFDFRGRVYPLTSHLHPQSHDVARGLLTFANGKPLGKSGYRWLLIQFANCWGVDKVGYDERVEWALEKTAVVRDALRQQGGLPYPMMPEDFDPLNLRTLWEMADKPWQALATLLELIEAWKTVDPLQYVCSLPVSVDGSNSGLQHFSAMLRDPEAGRLVNLLPCDKPMDIYGVVAEKARRAVERDAKAGYSDYTTIPDLPAQWLRQGITRYTGKRPSMTFVYGVTLQGMRDALVADGFLDWTDQPLAAVKYISRHLWDSITGTVTCAAEAMDWLRECAKVANRHKVLLTWTTPDGFHVRLPYAKYPVVRVKCMACEVYFQNPGETKEISEHQQRNSLAPNFIHSYDGTHLRMTLNHGWNEYDIHDWMMVHDSFGTLPCQVDDLLRSTKTQLVELYRPHRLREFRRLVIEQTGEDPGPPPKMGTMNLEDILESKYAFS